MNETTTNEMVQEDVWTKEEYQDTLRVFLKRDQMAYTRFMSSVPERNKEIIKRWLIFVVSSISIGIGLIYLCAEIFWSVLISSIIDTGARTGVMVAIGFVALFLFYGLVETLYYRIIK